MGLLDFLYQNKEGELVDYLLTQSCKKINAKDIAIGKAASMIAKSISKCEFKTYIAGKNGKSVESIGNDYYSLNIRPNPNQSGTNFWQCVIERFLTDPEGAVVIVDNGNLYLADTFKLSDSVVYPKTITDVTVGTLRYAKSFSMNDVLYLKLGDGKIIEYLNRFYEDIGKILSIAAADYKSKNKRKWNLQLPTVLSIVNTDTGKAFTNKEYVKVINDLLNDDESDVIPFGEGLDLKQLGSAETKTVQDFRDMLREALNLAAFVYDIPQDLFNGNKTDKSTSVRDFITFGLAGPIEIIEDEINAKWFYKEDYLKGVKVKIDTLRIQHIDFFDVADAEVKLRAAGYSHNDLRVAKGLQPIDEPWANERQSNISKSNEKGGEVK